MDILELLPDLHSFLLHVATEPPAQHRLTAADASVDMDLDIHILTKDWVKIILKLLQLSLPMRQPGRRIIVQQNPPALKDAGTRQILQPRINIEMTIIKTWVDLH